MAVESMTLTRFFYHHCFNYASSLLLKLLLRPFCLLLLLLTSTTTETMTGTGDGDLTGKREAPAIPTHAAPPTRTPTKPTRTTLTANERRGYMNVLCSFVCACVSQWVSREIVGVCVRARVCVRMCMYAGRVECSPLCSARGPRVILCALVCVCMCVSVCCS